MRNHLLTVVLLLLASKAQAQTVSVIDYSTQYPLQGVVVYSKNPAHSIQVNSKGQFELQAFANADSLYFRLQGFGMEIYSMREIELLKFHIQMKENPISINEFVISSNRWESKKIETPNRIESINMKEAAGAAFAGRDAGSAVC